MNPFPFQQKAIDELLDSFKQLWDKAPRGAELLLKAPTGSGKTFMVASFLHQLSRQPDWNRDTAYVWITFSDDLAMQSREKYNRYFFPNVGRRLLTVADLQEGRLGQGDILFLNWQKLVSRRAEDRKLRRPDNPMMSKEQGFYFEDVVENTHAEGREIVLIIDESHKNVTTAAERDVIEPLRPRIVLKVSATPEREPSYGDVKKHLAGMVEVEREEVVQEGLIKAQIVCQTEEDLQRHRGEDLDCVLLDLAIERREMLSRELQKRGIAVNPLVLVQLPNNDQDQAKNGIRTKESIVTEHLRKRGVPDNRVACWFDGRKEQMDGIEENENPVEFLLFKQAAGTGWDCPRAQILVMYREINSSVFYVQTLGRILRVPQTGQSDRDGLFCTGYLYTNYRRDEVQVPDQSEKNKPKIFMACNKTGGELVPDPALYTHSIPRADYGDLGDARIFQRSFISSMDRFFGMDENDMAGGCLQNLEQCGLKTERSLTNRLIVNARFENFDRISTEVRERGEDSDFEISRNDVEKIFDLLCHQLLKEQTEEEARIGNVARSWSPLKSALRLWMLHRVDPNADTCYRIFINDIRREGGSCFRKALTQALKDYRPRLDEQTERRKLETAQKSRTVFVVRKDYSYTEDYEEVAAEKCILDRCFLRKEYRGRENELHFLQFIDRWERVEWWLKNGDSGTDHLSVCYTDSETGKEALFYPDWIIQFTNGDIGLYDTKSGITASSIDTKNKAEALQCELEQMNQNSPNGIRYRGGIVVMANGVWYVNSRKVYQYRKDSLEEWEILG